MQHTFLGRVKSVAGAAFIGLGIFVLYVNLDRTASQWGHLFRTSAHPLGILPAVILAALRVLQAYASNRQQFLESLVQHLWLTFWPLVLVAAGTSLSRDGSRGRPRRQCE